MIRTEHWVLLQKRSKLPKLTTELFIREIDGTFMCDLEIKLNAYLVVLAQAVAATRAIHTAKISSRRSSSSGTPQSSNTSLSVVCFPKTHIGPPSHGSHVWQLTITVRSSRRYSSSRSVRLMVSTYPRRQTGRIIYQSAGFRCVICRVIAVRVFKGFAHSGGIERHHGPAGCPHDKGLTAVLRSQPTGLQRNTSSRRQSNARASGQPTFANISRSCTMSAIAAVSVSSLR